MRSRCLLAELGTGSLIVHVEGRRVVGGRRFVKSTATSTAPRPHSLRSAYISIVMAVQVASGGGEQLVGAGSLVGASILLRLIDDQTVLADLDLVLVALAAAGERARCHQARLPALEHLRVRLVGEAGQGEGEVGGAVEVAEDGVRGEALGVAQLDRAPLGPADRRAGDVERGRELGSARDDEVGWQVDLVHVAVDVDLEGLDHAVGDPADAVLEAVGGLGRGRELGSGDEQVLLQGEDGCVEVGLVLLAEGAGYPEGGVGLVDRAVGLGARVGLRDAAAVPEGGGAVVSLARVDLDHEKRPYRSPAWR